MTSRSEIIDGTQAIGRKYGLIYTRRCGWVDLGHANPDGAKKLWDMILNEKDEGNGKQGFFRIRYKQMMGNKYIKIGIEKKYDIKKNQHRRQEVGCTINFLRCILRFRVNAVWVAISLGNK